MNIYARTFDGMESLAAGLKAYVAEQLTCGDIALTPDEVSVRFVEVQGGSMLGDVEAEIVAHAFPERVARQDEICRNIMRYLEERGLERPKVWLMLGELGHSW